METLTRRLRSRMPLIPRTLTAGFGGAMLSVGLLGLAGSPFLHKPPIWVGCLLAGLLHGLVAPYLAPLQVRQPRALTLGSMVAFLGGFALLKETVAATSLLAIPGLALVLAATTLFATSLGEWVAGWRGSLATQSPGLARRLRLLSAWGAFTLGVYAMGAMDMPVWPNLGFLFQASLLGVVGVASAAAALETGKASLLQEHSEEPLATLPASQTSLSWSLAGGVFGAMALAQGLNPGHWQTVALTGILLGISGPFLARKGPARPTGMAIMGLAALLTGMILAPLFWSVQVSLLGSLVLATLTTALIHGASGASRVLLPRTSPTVRSLLTWLLTASGLMVVVISTQAGIQTSQALALLAWALPALAMEGASPPGPDPRHTLAGPILSLPGKAG